MAGQATVFALLLAGLAALGCGPPDAPTPDAPRVRLFDAFPREGGAFLERGEIHEYDVGKLAADDAFHAVVEQRGLDLVAQVVDPNGDVVLHVDGPTEGYGFEHVCFVADSPGTFSLRVGAWSADGTGSYGIRRRPRRPATEQDRACMAGTRTFADVERRRREGDLASAELAALYERAVDLWRQAAEPYPLAIALKQSGSYLAQLGDLDVALRSYAEALAILRSGEGQTEDPRQLAAVLNLRGLARGLVGEPDRARASFEEAHVISLEAGDRRGEATAISNLALWEKTLGGDLYRAVDLLEEALAIWRDLGRTDDEATTLTVLGGTVTLLGLYDEALDVLYEALELRQDSLPEHLANTWVAIGWAEHLAGRNEDAVDHFLRAARLYHEAGDRLGEAAAFDRLGSAYRRLGRFEEARMAFQTSLDVYRASADRLHVAHTATNLGCLQGEEEARDLLHEAGETFVVVGDRAALAHVRFCQARVERAAGHLDDALRRIEETAGLVHALRDAALRHGYQAPTLELWQEYSELHVDLLMAAGQEARAFEVSDLARARHLYEMLLESRVDVRSEVPDDLLERERIVQHRLNAVELRRQALLAQDMPRSDSAAVDRTLRQLLLELDDVLAAIRTASPRFAELRQPSPIRLEEVQRLLGPDTVLLSYALGEARSFLFLVSRDGLESHVLPSRETIDRLARRVYHGLQHSAQSRTRRQLPAMAARLSEMLLGPVRAELESRRLLVVGDGMLHYVPFAALPLPPSGGGDALLVEHHDVVHLPSAAVIKALRQRASERPRPSKKLAVLADAVYAPDDDRLPPAVRDTGKTPWYDLPYTKQEASSILALVPQEERLEALGFDASVDLVRSGALSAYRILHFATHGLLHDEHPALSGIVLSMFDEDGRRRDGHLRLHEVYALDLPADLVVLSGCRTALTRETRGAGLVGLTHGFFYAGASRLVVSLWNVHDEATAELMTRFYRGMLEEELPPPQALRAAQRWMRRQKRWQAEYYWAGFVLEGDWE